jgi:Family of unknown function (DUF6502)
MDARHNFPLALRTAIAHLLRPLFRVLLRHQMSFHAFEELAKRVYVDVALNDFAIPGKKPSISRASILSGLTRKEVQRLLAEPLAPETVEAERYNRAARVLTAWTRDPDFLDGRGDPLPLETNDGTRSFASLVKRHSGDAPVRAVLDELLRVGAVRRSDGGRLELVARAYVPQRSPIDKIAILGADVADLIDTIDHNIEHGDTDARFQRKLMYHSVPVAVLPEFRKLSSAQAQALLEKFDKWLAARDLPNPPNEPDAPRARVGLGIFYFEERVAAPDDQQGAQK